MEALIEKVRAIIDTCWDSFSAKVGGGLIVINKEASMQLQFAYLLKNTMDLVIHHKDESVSIELETGIKIGNKTRECDINIAIQKGDNICFLPIEMKCYKEYSSSGGKRGALDIFFKDVYVDLELLEAYASIDEYVDGIQLTMTDFINLVAPKNKNGKYFDYDITDGTRIEGGIHLQTPIGGKAVNIKLSRTYNFAWKQVDNFYFLKLKGE